jgi:DNA-binding NarL/FixJ family response regulator
MPSTRVLIIDDQPVFRQAARDLLEARGYAVVGEADGLATALAAPGRYVPDAVLLDVCLGKESGFDVARALTGARPGLAVLLVSADAGYEYHERVREVRGTRVRAQGASGQCGPGHVLAAGRRGLGLVPKRVSYSGTSP